MYLDNSGLGICSLALHSFALVALLKGMTIERIALIALYLRATAKMRGAKERNLLSLFT